MKKLKLDLDSVVVDSFRVEAEPRPRTGTVAAHDATEVGSCRGATCGLSCYPEQNSNCVCWPDTGAETWDNNCGSGEYSCEALTGGCECPSAHATNCPEC